MYARIGTYTTKTLNQLLYAYGNRLRFEIYETIIKLFARRLLTFHTPPFMGDYLCSNRIVRTYIYVVYYVLLHIRLLLRPIHRLRKMNKCTRIILAYIGEYFLVAK